MTNDSETVPAAHLHQALQCALSLMELVNTINDLAGFAVARIEESPVNPTTPLPMRLKLEQAKLALAMGMLGEIRKKAAEAGPISRATMPDLMNANLDDDDEP